MKYAVGFRQREKAFVFLLPLFSVQNISEGDLIKKELPSSENKVREIFEAMTEIVLIINVDGNVLRNLEMIPTNYSPVG